MRSLLAVLILAACARAEPSSPDPSRPRDAGVVLAGDGGSGPSVLDAGVVDGGDPITEIKALALAGPYPTLLASCQTARPCGFTVVDASGNLTTPPGTPNCDAAVDPAQSPVATIPTTISANGGTPKLTHATADREIRIGAVTCEAPKGIRSESSEHYVFVRRDDGWWRTQVPLLTFSYNEKYCGGGLYVTWNDKPARTIVGIAAAANCLACTKQAYEETVVELMVRVETTGSKPIVFAPLPVGARTRLELHTPNDPYTDPDCKPGRTATSAKERWVSDDEVILDGTGSGSVIDTPLRIGSQVPLAASGRYRFTR